MNLSTAQILSAYTDFDLIFWSVAHGIVGGLLIFRVGSYLVSRFSERSFAR